MKSKEQDNNSGNFYTHWEKKKKNLRVSRGNVVKTTLHCFVLYYNVCTDGVPVFPVREHFGTCALPSISVSENT